MTNCRTGSDPQVARPRRRGRDRIRHAVSTVPTYVVVRDPQMLREQLAQMRSEWLAFRRRYQDLAEYASLVRDAYEELA